MFTFDINRKRVGERKKGGAGERRNSPFVLRRSLRSSLFRSSDPPSNMVLLPPSTLLFTFFLPHWITRCFSISQTFACNIFLDLLEHRDSYDKLIERNLQLDLLCLFVVTIFLSVVVRIADDSYQAWKFCFIASISVRIRSFCYDQDKKHNKQKA